MKYTNHKAEHHTENLSLYQMDCMELLKQTPDNYFNLAITDPPYGIGINKSGRLGHYGGKGKSWDNAIPTKEYFDELERVSVNRIIWGANYFNMPPTRCFLIWDKQQPHDVSFASCEYAWTSFDKSAKTYYKRPQNADANRIHPTQKPICLYSWLLENYAEKGQKILDTHLGSMSSAIACHYGDVHLTGCELDEDYFKAGIQRVEAETRQLTLF